MGSTSVVDNGEITSSVKNETQRFFAESKLEVEGGYQLLKLALSDALPSPMTPSKGLEPLQVAPLTGDQVFKYVSP